MIIYKKNISYQIHRNSKHKNNKSLNNNNKKILFIYTIYIGRAEAMIIITKNFLLMKKDTYYNMIYKLQ